MTARYFTAWLSTDPSVLDDNHCDVVILEDELLGDDPDDLRARSSFGDPHLRVVLDARHDDDTDEAAIEQAEQALDAAGWRLIGDWEAVDTGCTVPVERIEPLTPAELRAGREHLGLTLEVFAAVAEVNPRTIRSWEQGRDRIPAWAAETIDDLRAEADAAVKELVEVIDQDRPVIIAHRDDEEHRAAGGERTAQWQRRIAARAAAEVTGARIVYGNTPEAS
jgi:DNA-binding transcriptional regulator YiaG